MKTHRTSLAGLAVLLALLTTIVVRAQETGLTADQLADAVFKASGGENWDKVKIIRFNFAGAAKHDWDIKAHTDTVTFKGKTVTVNVSHPASDDDSKAAFGRWTNDMYWLLAPLKVKDPGVHRTLKPDETVDGKTYHVLHLDFDKVGMTPGDQYNLLIDPESNLVRFWDYMPKPEKKTRFTWDQYREFGPLKLSTEHKVPGSDRKMVMSEIEVIAE